jgi:glycyl-tRNA synthetase beta chain
VEIGLEEVPARFLPGFVEQFRERLRVALDVARLGYEGACSYGAPRRVAALVRGLAAVQPDRCYEVRGPSAKAGLTPDGAPTRAAEGFARSQGVRVEDLVRRDNAEGFAYLFALKTEAGRPAADILPELVSRVVQAMQSPRNMRWGSLDFSFIRPVRWLLCLYGREALDVQIPGLPGDLCMPPGCSRGHRFLSPGPVKVEGAGDYVPRLRAAGVLADPAEREACIRAGASGAAAAAGGVVDLIPDLLVENVWLAEHPTAVYGSFDPGFLDLPEVVLTTAMRHHQRYFPVREPGPPGGGELGGRSGGRLTPGFVAVRDGGPEHLEAVRRGYERVLVARLADARFFYVEDRKRSLASRSQDLAGVVYHDRLGTLAEKAARLETLARWLGGALALDEPAAGHALRAAKLAKCDLVTQMVREFPELQGAIGGAYARLDGEPEEVASALEEQYRAAPTGAAAAALILSVADRADALAGYHYAGLRPTGSEDPYGMRRAAHGVVLALLAAGRSLDLRALANAAADGYVAVNGCGGPELAAAAQETAALLASRLEADLAEAGCAYDEIAAVMGATGLPLDPVRRAAACAALGQARTREWFGDLVTAAVRASGLGSGPAAAQAAGAPGATGAGETAGAAGALTGARLPDPARFETPEEASLWAAYQDVLPRARNHLDRGGFIDYWQELLVLKGPLDAFFDHVLVMAPEPALRANRLALCAVLHRLYSHAADLSRIVQDFTAER